MQKARNAQKNLQLDDFYGLGVILTVRLSHGNIEFKSGGDCGASAAVF